MACYYFLRRILMVVTVFHEPIRSQDRGFKDFVVGAFQLRRFSEFGRRLRTENSQRAGRTFAG